MKLLLDTHVFLTWLDNPALLSEHARVAIADPTNHVYVSAASIAEIDIEHMRGKLRLDEPPERKLAACRFHELPFLIRHASALRELPAKLSDPFRRILAAQALVESLTLVTRDKMMSHYEIRLIAA